MLYEVITEKSEKRYRELTEFLPELICEVNVKSELVYVNQFALNKFGYTRDEVLAPSFRLMDIFDEQEHGRVLKNIKRLLSKGGSLSNEYMVV